MKRRPRRSLPATLLALVLLAAGASVAITAVQLLLGEPPWLSYDRAAEALHSVRWADTAVLVAGIVVAALGLLLLLCALVPGARTVLPLSADNSAVDSGVSRRSYRDLLAGTAAGVDGVRKVRLRVRARSVEAVVRTDRTNTTGLADAVESALSRRLEQLEPQRRPVVKSKLKAVRSR